MGNPPKNYGIQYQNGLILDDLRYPYLGNHHMHIATTANKSQVKKSKQRLSVKI